MIAYPPLLDGAVHERLICVGDIGVAVKPVGVPGNVPTDDEEGVMVISDEGVPVPTELIAEILYEYATSVVGPV